MWALVAYFPLRLISTFPFMPFLFSICPSSPFYLKPAHICVFLQYGGAILASRVVKCYKWWLPLFIDGQPVYRTQGIKNINFRHIGNWINILTQLNMLLFLQRGWLENETRWFVEEHLKLSITAPAERANSSLLLGLAVQLSNYPNASPALGVLGWESS